MDLTKHDLRVMIFYDLKSGLSSTACHDRLQQAFGNQAPSYSTVKVWYEKLRSGKQDFSDDERSGRPVTASGDDNQELVRQMVRENPRISYESIAYALDIGNNAIQTITQSIGVTKVSGKFVPHELTKLNKR